jgi:hypothetical protein
MAYVSASSIFQAHCLALLERVESGKVALAFLDTLHIASSDAAEGEYGTPEHLKQVVLLLARIIQQVKRVLAENGNLFVLVSPYVGAPVRLLLERIFGEASLISEIVWPNGPAFSMTDHETILWYGRSDSSVYNPQFRKLGKGEIERVREQMAPSYPFEDERGAFALMVFGLASPTSDSNSGGNSEWRGHKLPPGYSWRFSAEELDQLNAEGRVYFPSVDEALRRTWLRFPLLKKYLHENLDSEVEIGSLWDDIPPAIPVHYRTSNGLVSFTGERPLALLERIVQLGSTPGDLVLDPSCQLGTSLIAAQANGREWIGGESSEDFYFASVYRLEDQFDLKPGQDFLTGHQDFLEAEYAVADAAYSEEFAAAVVGLAAPRFVLNQPVEIEETRHYEFKEIKGKNPVGSIESVADQYAVAFLNSEGGHIYWGIRDSDRTVTGVQLEYNKRDEIRRVVTEKLAQIQPAIAPTQYRIEFHRVYDGVSESAIPDLYVVELVVPRASSNTLYFTGRSETYVKTDGGKKRLTGPEIQEEIIKRLQ